MKGLEEDDEEEEEDEEEEGSRKRMRTIEPHILEHMAGKSGPGLVHHAKDANVEDEGEAR